MEEKITLQEAAQLALDALQAHADFGIKADKAITALRAAIENSEYVNQCGETCERAKLCAVCTRCIGDDE